MLETSKRTADGNSNGNHGESSPQMMSLLPDVVMLPGAILKRDGRLVPFEAERIENAIAKCFASLGYKPGVSAFDLTQQVVNIVSAKYTQPTVEQVQDIVEMVLQAAGEYEAAKHYILYRAEHAKMREKRPIPEPLRAAFADSDQYFPTQLQKFQFYDKYSRFNYELGRRETWIETVDRAVDYLRELSFARLPGETYARLRRAMLEMRAMTSMRLLAMAGPAARRNNITIYNCSYQPVDSIDSFVEAHDYLHERLRRGLLGREPLRRKLPARPSPDRPQRRPVRGRRFGRGLGRRRCAPACKPGSRAATSSLTSPSCARPAPRCAPRAGAPPGPSLSAPCSTSCAAGCWPARAASSARSTPTT